MSGFDKMAYLISVVYNFFSFITRTLKCTISLSSAMSCVCNCWCTEDPLQIILHFKRSGFK